MSRFYMSKFIVYLDTTSLSNQKQSPSVMLGLNLFVKELFLQLFMLLALFNYTVAVVAAEVGKPGLCNDGFAMCGNGSEMTLGVP